jgi:alanyl-tRNA synthetase
MALFGEKYEDDVRVVKVGDISMELCGGTHVKSTGEIGTFKIVTESSISAGVRRIEALCGEQAIDALQARERSLSSVAQMLNVGADQLPDRIAALMEENKRLSREVTKWKQAAATGGGASRDAKVTEIGDLKLMTMNAEGQDAAGLRMMVDDLKERGEADVFVLGAGEEGSVSLCVGVVKDKTKTVRAGDIVKQLAPIVGGGGGGRPDLAQAGGKLIDKLPEALEKAVDVVTELVG